MRKPWFQFCLREWKLILCDYRIVTILLGGPFFYALIFGGVYWQGRAKHVPIVIVDQDHSHLSREITAALDGSENCKLSGGSAQQTIFFLWCAVKMHTPVSCFPLGSRVMF